ncbi:glycosyltransferase family 4 protein [Turicibacter sanguinis]|uniref:glycosyltransferase family 4 protein n=1 Tax=Turicibacter sanguinis TaxID=154288 RepID=UPI0021D4D074|nr:glycosyltransferase family 4 protein [Turicibacter sanguinis]MCU7197747.1 glycosyltransferase family 4 protein [Turicibacter sanguinis]
MNITIFSLRGPTQNGIRGGAREYIYEIAKGLVKQGNNVNIICGAEPKHSLYESEYIDGVNVIRVGRSKWSIFSILMYYFRYLRNNTDIIIENMVSFPMYTNLFSFTKKHFTIVHHLTDKEYFKTHSIYISIIGYIMEKVTLRLYFNSKFIAVSEYTKQMLIQNGIKETNINIVNPGIREKFFEPGIKSQIPEIFYIGRFSAFGGNKKIDHLIQAFKNISVEIPNAKLYIAGKGDGVEVLEDLSQGYNIKFLGMINDEEKKKYMQRAWVFASPSLAEGFGITWIEAQACGTPVVGYKIEGLNTVTPVDSIMVNKNDIDGLSRAMISILNNKESFSKLSENAIQNSKNYSWENSISKFISIIE